MGDILVVGDALLDVHATPAEPMRRGGDVPAVVRLGVGGQGANLAVRLARRGLDVRLACAIGDDEAGPLVRDRLYRAGVTVVPMPARATGSVVILVDAAGERTMLSDRVPFSPALAVRLPELAPMASWIVVSGYLLEEPSVRLRGPAMGGVRRAVVSSPFRDTPGWRAALDALAPDLLVLNRAEGAALAGRETDDPVGVLATDLAKGGVAGLVVVTDVTGAAAASGDAAAIEVANEPDPSVVDTTGAGDAFAATLLAQLHAAWPPEPDALGDAMAEASRVATAVSRVVGAQAVLEDAPGTDG